MPNLTNIPGIPELWTRTKGDSRIRIAILDGSADLERACFVGANYTQIKPYWAEDIELNEEYFYYLKLATEFNKQQKAKKEDPDHDKDEAKKEREAFFEQFPQEIRQRIDLSSHATHISSTILGATPGTDEPIREKGTSCAAPIVTGISALLMSLQLQRGEQPNAEVVRQAILNSAIPCDPQEVEEPERCLLGKLNIPGAYQLLTGEALISVSLVPWFLSFPGSARE